MCECDDHNSDTPFEIQVKNKESISIGYGDKAFFSESAGKRAGKKENSFFKLKKKNKWRRENRNHKEVRDTSRVDVDEEKRLT